MAFFRSKYYYLKYLLGLACDLWAIRLNWMAVWPIHTVYDERRPSANQNILCNAMQCNIHLWLLNSMVRFPFFTSRFSRFKTYQISSGHFKEKSVAWQSPFCIELTLQFRIFASFFIQMSRSDPTVSVFLFFFSFYLTKTKALLQLNCIAKHIFTDRGIQFDLDVSHENLPIPVVYISCEFCNFSLF